MNKSTFVLDDKSVDDDVRDVAFSVTRRGPGAFVICAHVEFVPTHDLVVQRKRDTHQKSFKANSESSWPLVGGHSVRDHCRTLDEDVANIIEAYLRYGGNSDASGLLRKINDELSRRLQGGNTNASVRLSAYKEQES